MNDLEFDFTSLSLEYLREKSGNGFVHYHDVYRHLGRRFSINKPLCKRLLSDMEQRGFLEKQKRGVKLLV